MTRYPHQTQESPFYTRAADVVAPLGMMALR